VSSSGYSASVSRGSGIARSLFDLGFI
jgi:hypothetical protein